MRLYVMRHGVAMDRHDPAAPSDPERPLTADGSERTRLAVLGLVRLGVRVDRVLTSPFLRATQTAAIAAEPLGVPRANIEVLDALAPAQPLEDAVAAIEAGARSTLIVGHAPELDALIARLVGATQPLTSLKKAGVALLDVRGPTGGRLLAVYEPKVLRQLGRQ
jgi:phosphohistidine phosphatase